MKNKTKQNFEPLTAELEMVPSPVDERHIFSTNFTDNCCCPYTRKHMKIPPGQNDMDKGGKPLIADLAPYA